MDSTTPAAWLIPISGPSAEPLRLSATAKAEGLILGRHEQCDLRLPADAHQVSRHHARIAFDNGQWWLTDLNSRWGTAVNGWPVPPGTPLPLKEADLVRITPWTFSFSQIGPDRPRVQSTDDAGRGQTVVRTLAGAPAARLAEDRLAMLFESTAAIHSSRSEQELAEHVLAVACRGTRLQNAALLRPVDAAGGVEVLATRMSPGSGGGAAYSRALLAAAGQGAVAELVGPGMGPTSQSIVQMNIRAAICIPLILESSSSADGGGTIAAYLYLDSRGQDAAGLSADDSAFCIAVGRIAGLALANLKRMDIERRQAATMAEITAAAAAQRWILPKRQTRIGPFTCIGESRPGEYMGGDFFDLVPLAEGRMAVALGDVTGHGIAASVLMTSAQGFLHAALQEHGDAARAVTELNQFISPRKPEGKFITLWVGVFDPASQLITYVDAGHGYALAIGASGELHPLRGGDGLPVGLSDSAEYVAQQHAFAPGESALIVSDGIVEQPDGGGMQFGVAGIEMVLQSSTAAADEVAALFDAVTTHAGAPTPALARSTGEGSRSHFADDATAVLIRFG